MMAQGGNDGIEGGTASAARIFLSAAAVTCLLDDADDEACLVRSWTSISGGNKEKEENEAEAFCLPTRLAPTTTRNKVSRTSDTFPPKNSERIYGSLLSTSRPISISYISTREMRRALIEV